MEDGALSSTTATRSGRVSGFGPVAMKHIATLTTARRVGLPCTEVFRFTLAAVASSQAPDSSLVIRLIIPSCARRPAEHQADFGIARSLGGAATSSAAAGR
jgi:hypothetical protein